MRRLSKIEERCVDFRRSMCRPSKIDVTMCRPSEIDVSTFEDRCVNLRRWMCWPSKTDVSTFDDRWLMCWPSKIDSRCVDLRTSMVDAQLGCYTCSKYWYYSCMRIMPRVCTSVLSFYMCSIPSLLSAEWTHDFACVLIPSLVSADWTHVSWSLWQWQWTKTERGACFFTCACTPNFFPAIVAVPSKSVPTILLHWKSFSSASPESSNVE